MFAWNGAGAVVGPDQTGFEPPTLELMDSTKTEVWKKRTEVRGHYVAYNSWFSGDYGHFTHDRLPVLTILQENVPSTT